MIGSLDSTLNEMIFAGHLGAYLPRELYSTQSRDVRYIEYSATGLPFVSRHRARKQFIYECYDSNG